MRERQPPSLILPSGATGYVGDRFLTTLEQAGHRVRCSPRDPEVLYVIYSTERAPYQVIQNLASQVEIRQYEQQTWISTSYETDDSSFPV
jgi:hypothetical protein